jgi:hypothetical protein
LERPFKFSIPQKERSSQLGEIKESGGILVCQGGTATHELVVGEQEG